MSPFLDCFTFLLARHLAYVSCFIGPSMPCGICLEIHTKIVQKRNKKPSHYEGTPRQPHVYFLDWPITSTFRTANHKPWKKHFDRPPMDLISEAIRYVKQTTHVSILGRFFLKHSPPFLCRSHGIMDSWVCLIAALGYRLSWVYLSLSLIVLLSAGLDLSPPQALHG